MDPKNIFLLININDESDDKHISSIKLTDLRKTPGDELLLIIFKHVFFFDDNKFKCKGIKEKIKKYEWINRFIGSLITVFVNSTLENELTYGVVIKYFCEFYDYIKKDFMDFLKEIEKISAKINFDIFQVAICFLCKLNNNKNKFLKIISDLKKSDLIKYLEADNDTLTKEYLYYTITDYCILYNIPIILKEEYDTSDISKEKIIKEIKELKCYAELCPINKAYKNFLLLLCFCLKDSEDIRIGLEKNVSEFIDIIFTMLNMHLRNLMLRRI